MNRRQEKAIFAKHQANQLKKYAPEINQIQRTLLQIDTTGNAPINLTLYKNMGLVKTRYKHVKTGLTRTGKHKVFDRLILTDKGKRILNVMVN